MLCILGCVDFCLSFHVDPGTRLRGYQLLHDSGIRLDDNGRGVAVAVVVKMGMNGFAYWAVIVKCSAYVSCSSWSSN